MEKITAGYVREHLPPRDPMGHKGTFGRVAVLGGAVGYTGAPVYAGEAAARCGSGLVYAAVPREVYPIIASRCETTMAFPVPEDYPALLERLLSMDACAIGPGLGRGPETDARTRKLLCDLPLPVVLDADGINAAAEHIDSLREREAPTIVTPHEGEFLRLGGDLSLGREEAAQRMAELLGCILVLKGPETVVASPEGRLMVNTNGNCGMAKGGSGDVLTGMVLSLLGQGAEPFEAAAAAVWLHGRAGDLCARELTAYAMTPADMLRKLPAVFGELLSLDGTH